MAYDGGRYNSCRIMAMIGCIPERGTGFLYPTAPDTPYDYVITAKHIFTEGKRPEIDFNLLKSITMDFKDDNIGRIIISESQIPARLVSFDDDLAIIRINKQRSRGIERFLVKDGIDCNAGQELESFSYSNVTKDGFLFNYSLRERESSKVVLDDIPNNPDDLKGISGSGVLCCDKPFLLGIVSLYPYEGMAFRAIKLVPKSWNKINECLRERGWEELRIEESRYEFSVRQRDQSVLIDIRDMRLSIEAANKTYYSAYLNIVKALDYVRADLRDDWYFDPVQFSDVCCVDYVSDYFHNSENRESFKASPAEVFYIPKNAKVLRKAIVSPFIERLVYMAIVERLSARIEEHLLPYVYSARRNCLSKSLSLTIPGVEQWKKMLFNLDSWIESASEEACLVKVDLLNYYDSIHRDILISSLIEVCHDEEEIESVKLLSVLLEQMFGSSTIGLPQNNDASSLLASFYLSKVDSFMSSRTKHYCRFMDDIYFMEDNYYEAKCLMQELERELRKLNLAVNGQKVELFRTVEEIQIFKKQLKCDSLEIDKIEALIHSPVKLQRMKATSLLISSLKYINWASFPIKSDERKERDRVVRYCLRVMASTRFELGSLKKSFLKDFLEVVKHLQDDPEDTNMVLRILSSFSKETDTAPFHKEIEKMLLNRRSGLFEWQSYLLWMYFGSIAYQSELLERHAVDALSVNSETRKAEIAAIMIYLCAVRKTYPRNIIQMLQEDHLHGNLQQRTAIVCSRSLHPVDDYGKQLLPQWKLAHKYLFRKSELPLVSLYNPVSDKKFISDNDPIIDIVSGL